MQTTKNDNNNDGPVKDENNDINGNVDYPLRSLVELQGDGAAWLGRGLGTQRVHGETRELSRQLKHMKLGAGNRKYFH
jgi:hypothetical protein